jgi:predicted nucleic acid-binding protein
VSRQWVLDASPLIALAKVSLLHVADALCGDLVVPAGVAAEVSEGPEDDPGRIWLEQAGSQSVVDASELHSSVVSWDLGAGETEVLSYAYTHPGSEAILDDRAARTCARALSIPVRGTLGVILLAKKHDAIPAVEPVLRELTAAGFRISPELVKSVLGLADELA